MNTVSNPLHGERAHERCLIECLHVQRVQRREHRLIPRQELRIVWFHVEVHVPARLQLAAQLGKEVARPQRVREHVIADDEVELALERDLEVLEIDEGRRGDVEQLAQQELLALPDRHGVDRRTPGTAEAVENRPGARSHFDDSRTAGFDERTDDVGVDAVLEAIAQERREVLLAVQPKVIGHEHAVRRQAAELVAIGVAERIGIEQPVGDLTGAARAALGDDLAKMREQKIVAAADRAARRIQDAARVAHRVVVACRGLVGCFRDQDELVPGIDQRPLGAAAHGTGIERQPLAAFRIRKRFLVANRLPDRRLVIRRVHRNRSAGELPLRRFVRARDARHPTELVVVLQHARVHLAPHLAHLLLQHAQLAVERTPPRAHRRAQTPEHAIDDGTLVRHCFDTSNHEETMSGPRD